MNCICQMTKIKRTHSFDDIWENQCRYPAIKYEFLLELMTTIIFILNLFEKYIAVQN